MGCVVNCVLTENRNTLVKCECHKTALKYSARVNVLCYNPSVLTVVTQLC